MKEQFSLAASKSVLQHLNLAADKAGLSRGQTFEDFLTFVRCSLAGQTMEEEYLQTVAKGYVKGKDGKRGIDSITKAFGMTLDKKRNYQPASTLNVLKGLGPPPPPLLDSFELRRASVSYRGVDLELVEPGRSGRAS